MIRILKSNKLWIAFLITCVSVLAIAVITSSPASATSEKPESTISLAGVTLSQNTSYVSDSYFGVINVSVQDESIARASVDSQCHVVVTAISEGTTKITYWYKKSSGDGWTSATMPVTVSVSSKTSSSMTTSNDVGIVFPKAEIGLNVGGSYAMTGVKVNGFAVESSSLLWFSDASGVISVDNKTGKITGTGAGTAVLYAIDPTTNDCNSITVKVVKA